MSVNPPKPVKKADWFLSNGANILADRGKTYDKDNNQQERSMQKVVKVFKDITGKDLTETEGWMFMVCLKGVRAFAKKDFHEDSWQDLVNYAALGAEAKAAEEVADPTPVKPTYTYDEIFLNTEARALTTIICPGLPKQLLTNKEAGAWNLYRNCQEKAGYKVNVWEDLDYQDKELWLMRVKRVEPPFVTDPNF